MAGHSQFKNIMHRKGRQDAQRSKLFAKIGRELTVAAKSGMPDPAMNPRLRAAVQAARAVNMPRDTIERAIKKGSGVGADGNYEEVRYEGFGPGGVAIIVEALTDNRNRTAGEIRSLFSKNGGNMAEPGAVAYMFTKRGVITLEGADEDRVMETALEAGALDVQSDGSTVTVLTEPMAMEDVREALGKAGLSATAAEIQNLPSTTVKVEGKEAASLMKLLSALEDHDDVDRVSANFEMSDELMEQLSA